MSLHETHVCRDCGAEITLPYVRPAPQGDAMTPSRDSMDGGQALVGRSEAMSHQHDDDGRDHATDPHRHGPNGEYIPLRPGGCVHWPGQPRCEVCGMDKDRRADYVDETP